MTTAQDTVTAVADLLDSIVTDCGQAGAALRAIQWTVDPPPPPPPPPPPTARASGYNPDNGPGGTKQPSGIDAAPAIGAWRGSPLGAYNVFQYGHLSRTAFVDSYTKSGWTPFRTVPILNHLGIMPILTIPGSVGDQKPDVSYADVAKGALDAEHKGNAAFIAGAGEWQTDVALRFAREPNTLGSWYYGATPAERAQWAKAIAHLHNDIYVPALGKAAVLVVCPTKRAQDGEWEQAVPWGAVDRLVIGIDAYLNKPSIDTPAGFADNWVRLVEPKINTAIAHGCQVAIPEWAVTDVDQPGNVQRLLDYTEALRKENRLHHEHYFGNTAAHAIFGKTQLPKSAAAYAEWYKGH